LFFSRRAGCFNETKEIAARISWTAADRRMLERIARSGKNSRIARSKDSARVAASHREQLFANPVSDSRNRYFQKLLSPRDRQKSQSRHVWFERSRRPTAAAASVP